MEKIQYKINFKKWEKTFPPQERERKKKKKYKPEILW